MLSFPPLIGITTVGRSDKYFKLREEYIDTVRRAGGIPVMVAPGEPHLEVLLQRLDGFILSGGPDIDPAHYGSARNGTMSPFDPDRDQMEMILARRLVDAETPALFICRGAQVLNVALGGTLIEDVPGEVGRQVTHRAEPRDAIPHPVTVNANSRLADLLGQTEFTAASWHHQAARQVAPALTPVAYAPDGVIEALEMPGNPWLVAVQWHPELTAAADPVQQRLFDWLVETARRRVSVESMP